MPPREPVAPSIVSRPPLRAAASSLAQRSPCSLLANHSAPATMTSASTARIASVLAGVDECRDAPEIADPAHDFRAAECVVASSDRCIADARSKAVEFVPAHGRIAAGAEEQLDRYVARPARGDGAALELEYDLCLGVDRQPCRELQDAAAHRGGRD